MEAVRSWVWIFSGIAHLLLSRFGLLNLKIKNTSLKKKSSNKVENENF